MGVDGLTSSTQGAIPGIVGGMSGTGTPLGEPGVYGYKELRRTPSTSAIYETLRRYKELRESLTSRPSSRLSIDNNIVLSKKITAPYFKSHFIILIL